MARRRTTQKRKNRRLGELVKRPIWPRLVCSSCRCGLLRRERLGRGRWRVWCDQCDWDKHFPPISKTKRDVLAGIKSKPFKPRRPRCRVRRCTAVAAEGGLCDTHWRRYRIEGKPEPRADWIKEQAR